MTHESILSCDQRSFIQLVCCCCVWTFPYFSQFFISVMPIYLLNLKSGKYHFGIAFVIRGGLGRPNRIKLVYSQMKMAWYQHIMFAKEQKLVPRDTMPLGFLFRTLYADHDPWKKTKKKTVWQWAMHGHNLNSVTESRVKELLSIMLLSVHYKSLSASENSFWIQYILTPIFITKLFPFPSGNPYQMVIKSIPLFWSFYNSKTHWFIFDICKSMWISLSLLSSLEKAPKADIWYLIPI